VVAHADQRVERDPLVAELRHRAHLLWVDAVVACADERIVGESP